MRSWASFSAARASPSQEARAASISATVTFRPVTAGSNRSNFRVRSIRAWSPRAMTSAITPRTTCSTSTDASRLLPRKALNRTAKSAARLSRRIGKGPPPALPRRAGFPGNDVAGDAKSTPRRHIVRMIGTGDRVPGRPEIGQLAFEALDLEAELAAAGEDQGHGAGRRRGLAELDGKQIEHGVLGHRIDGAALAG